MIISLRLTITWLKALTKLYHFSVRLNWSIIFFFNLRTEQKFCRTEKNLFDLFLFCISDSKWSHLSWSYSSWHVLLLNVHLHRVEFWTQMDPIFQVIWINKIVFSIFWVVWFADNIFDFFFLSNLPFWIIEIHFQFPISRFGFSVGSKRTNSDEFRCSAWKTNLTTVDRWYKSI